MIILPPYLRRNWFDAITAAFDSDAALEARIEELPECPSANGLGIQGYASVVLQWAEYSGLLPQLFKLTDDQIGQSNPKYSPIVIEDRDKIDLAILTNGTGARKIEVEILSGLADRLGRPVRATAGTSLPVTPAMAILVMADNLSTPLQSEFTSSPWIGTCPTILVEERQAALGPRTPEWARVHQIWLGPEKGGQLNVLLDDLALLLSPRKGSATGSVWLDPSNSSLNKLRLRVFLGRNRVEVFPKATRDQSVTAEGDAAACNLFVDFATPNSSQAILASLEARQSPSRNAILWWPESNADAALSTYAEQSEAATLDQFQLEVLDSVRNLAAEARVAAESGLNSPDTRPIALLASDTDEKQRIEADLAGYKVILFEAPTSPAARTKLRQLLPTAAVIFSPTEENTNANSVVAAQANQYAPNVPCEDLPRDFENDGALRTYLEDTHVVLVNDIKFNKRVKIFYSYSGEDIKILKKLRKKLSAYMDDIIEFIDKEAPTTNNIHQQFADRIVASDVVVCAYSDASVLSIECKAERHLASTLVQAANNTRLVVPMHFSLVIDLRRVLRKEQMPDANCVPSLERAIAGIDGRIDGKALFAAASSLVKTIREVGTA